MAVVENFSWEFYKLYDVQWGWGNGRVTVIGGIVDA